MIMTNFLGLYNICREVVSNPEGVKGVEKLYMLVDRVFFNYHIEFDKGSYDVLSKSKIQDEYNLSINGDIVVLELNRETTNRILKIYVDTFEPQFAFEIYDPSLSNKPMEYGEWSLKQKRK